MEKTNERTNQRMKIGRTGKEEGHGRKEGKMEGCKEARKEERYGGHHRHFRVSSVFSSVRSCVGSSAIPTLAKKGSKLRIFSAKRQQDGQ